MKSLLLSLLADPFGVSKENLKALLQIMEDEEGEAVAEEIETRVTESQLRIPGFLATTTRFFIKE